ncbi:early nodulin-like protein 9 [Hibiscus trionum]|uniref:Early nodulin-like protein 9 n=1 Tax=Hibiscus trionum TaxID=183268 RepID=A0A9W7LH09_HIBTR|nr:early nodulin-like protein 9 [Hibiscus trionum]
MANSIFRHQSKGFLALGLFCFMQMMILKGYAREYQVNWGLHNGSNAENYNHWAEKNRFQIGDSLVFSYAPNDDSVLHVTEDAYKNCKLESPIAKYTDGHTVFSLDRSGPYYFISGNKDNCGKNEKLVVVVLADRSNRSSTGNETLAPSPPPSGSTEPPSPAPSGESPPVGTVEINPTPAPSEETKPSKNGATSLVLMGVTGSTMGAMLVASTLVLGF